MARNQATRKATEAESTIVIRENPADNTAQGSHPRSTQNDPPGCTAVRRSERIRKQEVSRSLASQGASNNTVSEAGALDTTQQIQREGTSINEPRNNQYVSTIHTYSEEELFSMDESGACKVCLAINLNIQSIDLQKRGQAQIVEGCKTIDKAQEKHKQGQEEVIEGLQKLKESEEQTKKGHTSVEDGRKLMLLSESQVARATRLYNQICEEEIEFDEMQREQLEDDKKRLQQQFRAVQEQLTKQVEKQATQNENHAKEMEELKRRNDRWETVFSNVGELYQVLPSQSGGGSQRCYGS